MNVRKALERLLDVTAQATALKVRADVLRAHLHEEAVRRYHAEEAAPSWSVRGLGKVRLDGADAPRKARVEDAAAYSSWVAEHVPHVATAVIELPPSELEAALEALEFARLEVKASRVEVDEHYTAAFLDGLELTVETIHEAGSEEPLGREIVTALAVDQGSGETFAVPGIGAQAKPSLKLVVNLDPARKRDVIADAEAELDAEERVDAAAEEFANTPVDQLREPGTVTPDLEAPLDEARASAAAIAADESAQLEAEQAERFRDEIDHVEHAAQDAERAGEQAVEAVDPGAFTVEEARRVVAPIVARELDALGIPRPDDDADLTRRIVATRDAVGPHRRPYVGDGVDGARRSAEIDRTEADTYPTGSDARDRCLRSAIRWEQQADDLIDAGEPVVDPVAVHERDTEAELMGRAVDTVDAPVLAEPVVAPVEDTTPEPVDDDLEERRTAAHDRAVANARETLRQLAASDDAWASAKAADLHRLKVTADLGLGKGKVGKAQLRTEVTAALEALA